MGVLPELLSVGAGVAGQIVGMVKSDDAASAQQKILNETNKKESELETAQLKQLAFQESQPALLEQRSLQEQMNASLQTAKSPNMNPLSIASSGGLRSGKLG